MKQSTSSESEHNEQDREIIEILKALGDLKATYPPELLSARRAAFLEQVERLRTVELDEGASAEDQKVVKLLGHLKSTQSEYPPELLAARRSAFLSQLETAGRTSLFDKLRISLQRIFQSQTSSPTLPPAGLRRMSLVIASLVAAVLIGSLFFSRAQQTFQPSPSEMAAASTPLPPTSASEVAILICKPEDQAPACSSAEVDPSQDLADPGNGVAQPAVSSQPSPDGIHKAAYVNDGRGGTSWVSKSADSWVKIDLGKVRTINSVSLQKGSLGASYKNNPGQFVIAVALSDVYADGDSSDDYVEYAQVFRSEQAGFSGTVSEAETIRAQFPPVKARFVKITFEKAGAAIEEAGVFLVPPPVLAEQPTRRPQEEVPGLTATLMDTNTASGMNTTTALPNDTSLAPTDTAVPTLTVTSPLLDTPTPLPTNTPLPTDTSVPIPTNSLPSDTPMPLPTVALPTAIPATVQSSLETTGTIIVTGHDQTLTFTCNGDAVEIRGYANIVTLLGSCSSITVTGNRNRVFWQFGLPVITNTGKENMIEQL